MRCSGVEQVFISCCYILGLPELQRAQAACSDLGRRRNRDALENGSHFRVRKAGHNIKRKPGGEFRRTMLWSA